MTETNQNVLIRKAEVPDAPGIAALYHLIYQGSYPDPVMTSLALLAEALRLEKFLCIIGADKERVVSCVVYKIDRQHNLAKVFGAVVDDAYRGHHLTEKMMHFGLDILNQRGQKIQAIYATTRTVTAAPQKLTENLGFKKLGVFPNVHKTNDYETHGLTCFYPEGTLERRYLNFHLHFRLAGLYKIVQTELNLPDLIIAEEDDIKKADVQKGDSLPVLEIIDEAEDFVKYRFNALKEKDLLPISFFPFYQPNQLITSPDQSVEIFLSIDEKDKHCVIVGMKKPKNIHHHDVYNALCQILKNRGVRYIETVVRADKLMTIDETLQARFIPCAYFPAFAQARESDLRLDFVIFSRTFEQLDFSNIQLEGTNRRYLIQYFKTWKEISLTPKLLSLEEATP